MIRHLFSIIWNQRKTNAWIWVELLLVSVFLWYIVDYLLVTGYTLTSPKGYDTEHTYYIALSEKGNESEGYIPLDRKATTTGEDLLTIADRIRTYPGVEAVSYSRAAYPYCQNRRGRQVGADTANYIPGRLLTVTPDYFRVFNIKGKDGRDIPIDGLNEKTFVITEDMEATLFGNSSGIGQLLHYPQDKENTERYRSVAAVTQKLRYTEYHKADYAFYDILTPAIMAGAKPEDVYAIDLCIRVAPDADKDFAKRFRADMDAQLSVGNVYLLDIRTVESFHDYFVGDDSNALHTQLAVLFFLLLNIFLGIIGTFWVRTEARKGEMGLRVALGGTPRSLIAILIEEGMILLGLATIPSAIICLNLGLAEVVEVGRVDFTVLRFLAGTLITFGLMALMIIIGIWYPARQAATVQPAEALHYE